MLLTPINENANIRYAEIIYLEFTTINILEDDIKSIFHIIDNIYRFVYDITLTSIELELIYSNILDVYDEDDDYDEYENEDYIIESFTMDHYTNNEYMNDIINSPLDHSDYNICFNMH